ncbi:hypothetical protein ACROYT_G000949 [Oculina patagonica]
MVCCRESSQEWGPLQVVMMFLHQIIRHPRAMATKMKNLQQTTKRLRLLAMTTAKTVFLLNIMSWPIIFQRLQTCCCQYITHWSM